MYRIALGILSLLLFASASAQVREITVNDTAGIGIGNVYVTITTYPKVKGEKSQIYITGKDGKISFEQAGTVLVTVSHTGFVTISDTLTTTGFSYVLVPLDVKLEETVITAQYSHEDIQKSMYTVKVINREKIEQRASNNVSELLCQEMNIRVAQDPFLGAGMTLQGLSGEQIKYLVDGVPIIGRVKDGIDISQVNLNDVEKIEIIEGPVSVLYGNNALGGVINLITRTDQAESFRVHANGYYESVGKYNVDAGVSMSKKNHFVSLSGGRYYFQGYGLTKDARDVEFNPATQYFGSLKYGYQWKKIRFLLSGNYFNEKITNKGNARQPLLNTAFDDYYYTQRASGALTIDGDIFKNHYFNQVVAYSWYQRKKNAYFTNLSTLGSTLVGDSTAQDTTVFKAIVARGFVSRTADKGVFNYQFGYDINSETGSGKRLDGGTRTIGDYALFVSARVTLFHQRFVIQPAVRWSYNTAFRAPVAPSINFRINPAEHFTIRLSYARGFRAPSVKELYFAFYDVNHNVYGNPNLTAEYSHNVTLNLTYARTFGQHLLNAKLNGFFNYIENAIELVRDYNNPNTNGGLLPFTYINDAKKIVVGTNISVKYIWDESLTVSLSAGVVGTETTFKNQQSGGLVFSPEISSEISYLIPKALIRVSFFNKFNGRGIVPYVGAGGNVGSERISPYDLMEASVGRKFWKDRFNISVGAKNLLNVKTVDTSGGDGAIHSNGQNYILVGWGTAFFASVRFNFISGKS